MSDILPYKVFFIDDDEDEFLLFQHAMSELAIEADVRYIDNCAEMLDLLDKGDIPDLLFLDLNMPVISGKECVKKIRQRLQDHLPIIIYSTSKYQPDVDETHRAGANLYVIKPNSFNGLMKALKTVFSMDWKQNFHQPAKEKFLLQV